MSAEHGWRVKDRGTEIEKKCTACGRSLYVMPSSTTLNCDGCGCSEDSCYCPDARERELVA